MKIQIFISLLMVWVLFPLLGAEWPRAKIDCADRLVNQVLNGFIRRIESKYQLKCIASTAAMCGGPVRHVLLMFKGVGPVPQADLRRLLVACIHEVLDSAQQVPDFVSVLQSPPFGVNSVNISILLSDENGNSLYEPDIASASIRTGNIDYDFLDPEGKIFPCKYVSGETYDEALEAIRREGEELQKGNP